MSNAAIITSLPHFGIHFKDVANIEFLSRLMITIPSLAIALLSPFLGHLIYKTSVVRSALFGLVLFGLAGSAGLYLGDIYHLLFSRIFLGVAIAILMIVGTSLIGDYFKGAARHKFMGLQSACVSVGGILFISGGGILSDIHWKYPFGIYLIGLCIVPMVIFFLKEPSNLPHEEDEKEISGSLYSIYFLAFIMMLLFYVLPTQMPFLIMNHFGASGTIAGFIISFAMGSSALGALSFPKFKRSFSFKSIYLISIFVQAFGFIAIGSIGHVSLFFLSSSVMGFSNGLLMTTTMAWMLERAHHSKRIKASAYFTSALYAGQFCSPVLFHPVVEWVGLQGFFILLGVSLLVMISGLTVSEKVVKIIKDKS